MKKIRVVDLGEGIRMKKVVEVVKRLCSECQHELTIFETGTCDVCILERNGGVFPNPQEQE